MRTGTGRGCQGGLKGERSWPVENCAVDRLGWWLTFSRMPRSRGSAFEDDAFRECFNMLDDRELAAGEAERGDGPVVQIGDLVGEGVTDGGAFLAGGYENRGRTHGQVTGR